MKKNPRIARLVKTTKDCCQADMVVSLDGIAIWDEGGLPGTLPMAAGVGVAQLAGVTPKVDANFAALAS